MLTLPQKATPVDFAFQVHTEVGFHCIGAKVNGKMVPLSYKLSSGDQVEVITSKKQAPNPDWAKFVVTHKAKARIRHWINEKRRKAAEHGRELLDKRLKKARLDVDEPTLNRTASKLRYSSMQQMLFEIGTGLLDPAEVTSALKGDRAATEQVVDAPTSKEEAPLRLLMDRFTREAEETSRPTLIIDGEEQTDLATEHAACCTPIPGDDVVGYVSRTGSIKIHRSGCRNAQHLVIKYPERIVPVEWSRQQDVQFVAALRLVGEDRVGIVSDITTVISKNLKTNIRSITVQSDDGIFEGTLVLYVSDLKHLRRLMQRLGRVESIYGVYRLEE